MTRYAPIATAVVAAMLLGGCAPQPLSPSVPVMPAPNKPFDAFQQDQAVCRQFAQSQVAGQENAGSNQVLGSAIVGTVLGAGLGAALGGGKGAAIGAASGAVAGTAYGAGTGGAVQMTVQQHYDNAYMQCMYSRGNQVPGYRPGYAPPPPPGGTPPAGGAPPPPPPPGSPPPQG
ncbi:MAG TPA: glycine zipper family protein [Alphaproteobacteria bacterium]|nr:glycine zipper family protein [Alphaproteobacteria bacterium]